MKSLREIYDTETTHYTSKWNNYFDIYETYLTKFRGQSPVVVECGIDNGGFLQVLHKYFGNGVQLFGIDLRPKITVEDLGLLGVAEILQADQGNSYFWDTYTRDYPSPTIFLDDGSHFMHHQILTFERVFPHLEDGGYYFIEDTHSSYMPIFGGLLKKEGTFIEYCMRLVDMLHSDHIEGGYHAPEWMRWIKSISFYDSMVVVEKGLRPKYEVTFTKRDLYIK